MAEPSRDADYVLGQLRLAVKDLATSQEPLAGRLENVFVS